MTAALTIPRPTWRGLLHAWAFWLTIPAGLLLVVVADQAAARTAASIYTVSLLALFGTSAAYHRLARSERARRIMQRLDHSMIYVLIAGTYVPLCIVALPGAWGVPLLVAVGVCGAVGMSLKLLLFQRARIVSYALYPVMGWLAVIAAPVMTDSLTATQLALVVGGGVAYTAGFPVLLVKRPDPWPTVFGYHEVWHLCTVLAAGLHFAAVTTMVA